MLNLASQLRKIKWEKKQKDLGAGIHAVTLKHSKKKQETFWTKHRCTVGTVRY